MQRKLHHIKSAHNPGTPTYYAREPHETMEGTQRWGAQFFCGKALGSSREEIQISSQTVQEEFKATTKSQVPISGGAGNETKGQ